MQTSFDKIIIHDKCGPLNDSDLKDLLSFSNISLTLPDAPIFLYLLFRTMHLSPKFSFLSEINLKHLPLYFKAFLFDLDFGPLDRFLRKIRKKQVLKYISKRVSFRILDVGCGRQASLGWDLKGRDCTYYGLDKDIPEGSFKNLHFTKNCAERISLSLPPSTFDYVVVLAVLEHLEDPLDFLRSSHCLLVSQGELILTTPPPVSKSILEVLSLLHLINSEEIEDHKSYYKLSDLARLLEQAGFHVVEKRKFLFGLNSFIVGRKIS